MNKTELLALIPDHKTANRFMLRTDGRVYLVFGMTESVILAQECYFNANNELTMRSLMQLPYDEFDAIVERECIANWNGEALVTDDCNAVTSIETIKQQLIEAGKFSVNPSYSLFSYRDGEWTLVASLNSADDMASEYHRYCLSGQWGDCLEVRCNGVRVRFDAMDC